MYVIYFTRCIKINPKFVTPKNSNATNKIFVCVHKMINHHCFTVIEAQVYGFTSENFELFRFIIVVFNTVPFGRTHNNVSCTKINR